MSRVFAERFARTVAALTVLLSGAAVAETRSAPEPGRTYRIGFAQIVDHPALNATRKGFIDGLRTAGFEEGKNLIFDYQNAQGNPGAAHSIIQKFIDDKVDSLRPALLLSFRPQFVFLRKARHRSRSAA